MTTTRRTRLLLLSAALAAAVVAVTLSFHASATTRGVEPSGATTTVLIDPAAQNVSAGSDAIVHVDIENVSDPDGLGAYEFALIFDPSVLTFESYTNGSFLGSSGRSPFCLPPLFDGDGDTVPDPGYVRVGCITTGDGSGPTGAGLLGTLKFGTSCAGMSSLEFDTVGVSDPLGSEIESLATGGSVTVTGGTNCATPTPTVTVTPTRTATPVPRPGDVNCSGTADPVDATLVLQKTADLLQALACPQNGDVNKDGSTNAIDATLILQFAAGLIGQL